jgi:GAF domain-containing protein
MTTKTARDLFDRLGQPARIRQIARYNLFEPLLRTRLDAVAARTAAQLQAPVSLVSVILDSAQFILGSYGVDGWVDEAQGTPAEWALCTHTVLAGEPYCITDATTDPTHAGNPLVAMTSLRSYAGVPLIDHTGQTLGAHCVIDAEPRTFTDTDIAVLSAGAEETLRILSEYRVT